METHIISHCLHGIDSQKQPLRKLIHCYDRLRENPREYLAEREVVIRSAPYWVLAVMIGFLVFAPLVIATGVIAKELGDRLGKPPPWLGPIIAGAYVAGIFAVPVWAVRRLLPRRTITFRSDGVVFSERHKYVTCPWSLFRARGEVHLTGEDRVLVPVNSQSVPQVELRRDEWTVASGWSVDTSLFRLRLAPFGGGAERGARFGRWLWSKLSGTPLGIGDHAIFPNQFKASGLEIGVLLLELAWKMEEGDRG